MHFQVKDYGLADLSIEVRSTTPPQISPELTANLTFFGASAERSHDLFVDRAMRDARKIACYIAQKSAEEGWPLRVAVDTIAGYNDVNIGLHKRLRTPENRQKASKLCKFIALAHCGRIDWSQFTEPEEIAPVTGATDEEENDPQPARSSDRRVVNYGGRTGVIDRVSPLTFTVRRTGAVRSHGVMYKFSVDAGGCYLSCNCHAWIYNTNGAEITFERECVHTNFVVAAGYPRRVRFTNTQADMVLTATVLSRQGIIEGCVADNLRLSGGGRT